MASLSLVFLTGHKPYDVDSSVPGWDEIETHPASLRKERDGDRSSETLPEVSLARFTASAVKGRSVSLHGDSRSDRGMTGDLLNPTPPIPPQERPLWVTWFAHPFANWFWFYFGFVAALSGSNMGYPSLGPIVMFGWLTGHLVNAKHPWGELKLFIASLMLGYFGDGLITWLGVLKFRETTPWTWMVPFWMAMMWPNFAATLNSSMKWLRGRYLLGAILGAISGPFSYYGGVKWGAVKFGVEYDFWPAMTIIGFEWLFAMPALLWLSARWVPKDA